MQNQEKLALILPALREAENLGHVLCTVRAALDRIPIPWEVLVVDDDSRDGTEAIVGAITREDARVRLLVRHNHRGLAGAILHGWQHTDASIYGVMDADGQHPPEVLPDLLAAILRGRDLAIASRYTPGGRCGSSRLRWLISQAAMRVACPLLPLRSQVCDPISGFFLVRRRCIQNVRFQTRGFKLLLEILARAPIGTVEEIPFAFGRRRAGKSKISLAVTWDYVTLLARLYRSRWEVPRIKQPAAGD